jgi:hypothetical protein
MPTWFEELAPVVGRAGLRPTEIAALCLLRRYGDAEVRNEAFQSVLNELFHHDSRDPLVTAALISLLAHPDADTRLLAQGKVAWLANDVSFAALLSATGDDSNKHFQTIRLACARFPSAFEVIVALGPDDLVKGLTKVPAGSNPVAPTATEGGMGHSEPTGDQIVSLALPAETVTALQAQARLRGQTLEAYLQHLAALKAIGGANDAVLDAEFDQLLDELHKGPEAPPLPADFSRADIYTEHD